MAAASVSRCQPPQRIRTVAGSMPAEIPVREKSPDSGRYVVSILANSRACSFRYTPPDNFRADDNQLASTLSRRRIRRLLAQYWNIRSAQDFQKVIEQRLCGLGAVSSEEAGAIEAWHAGARLDTTAYRSLQDVIVFLSAHAGIVKPGEIREQHCHMVAWDVQQVAYLLRLGFTMGYISRDSVRRVLERLQKMARIHYTSWKDYSLSALVGMGLRGVLDLDDIGDWYQIARTHTVLLAARRSLLARAGEWSAPLPSADAGPVSSFSALDVPITAFDTYR